ncbi:MAG TPA: protein kinase [Polyangiaceae bacterium LLY-WYZ-15_(1-7)]|nr:protein kinase [Polyangiaceae bacterium LLY-WYZ-15_(1-7)]HJL06413.1 protein kinase [Polyangiaceae bacterium LLY-WYZ-15_(1-7)]HJL11342.1 protein kinase [Polyangiaceae bacterium LLY-WYZ-15_(1-7)]HJL23297.1 protein kinase [Polyangiaceae bacterium LLY-WYZ-15_(1-7)]HJL33641.1 protein kinase [Polyangiaceae bacterium LLY-WYZ-15_(1-7)]
MKRRDESQRVALADTVIGDSSGEIRTPASGDSSPGTAPGASASSTSASRPVSSSVALAETVVGDSTAPPRLESTGPVALADTVIGDSASGVGSSPGARPSPAASDADRYLGAKIDHYRIESLLGEGGMGAVYAAHDVSLDRPVALKMLRGALTQPGYEERLMREARAQAKVPHANIVQIYYIGRARPEGAPADESAPLYFAMERVGGESLEAILDAGERMSPEAARIAMLQVARGLKAARKVGIIHRDIKPSNLMRDREGRIKIADFGLAKPMEGDVSITQEGAFVGSPLYMSPEQASGDPVDHRADMYSLGATFYHLLAGHPPFDGDTPLKVISRHLSKPVPPLAEAAPEVPPALRAILHKLLEKDPKDRFEDYDALLEALSAADPARAPYAGFWIRAAASLIDTIVAGILIALVGWVGLVLHLAHVTVGHALFGQTLGKKLLHVRVRQLDGKPLGWKKAVLRTLLSLWMPVALAVMILVTQGFVGLTTTIEQLRLGEMGRVQHVIVALAVSNGVLSLMYGAGLAVAGFQKQKRAMHDLLSGTVVRYVLPTGTATR